MTEDKQNLSLPNWQPIPGAPNFWHAETTIRGHWPVRMVAFLLADNTTAVISPLPNTRPALPPRMPSISCLVAPNHFHGMGLGLWKKQFPHAKILATETAAARLRKTTKLSINENDTVVDLPLMSGQSILALPSVKTGECWLTHQDFWIVTDAFFHLTKPLMGLRGTIWLLLLWITRTGPGLQIGRTFMSMVTSRSNYNLWLLETIQTKPPKTLIPLHGTILTDKDLAGKLDQLRTKHLE